MIATVATRSEHRGAMPVMRGLPVTSARARVADVDRGKRSGFDALERVGSTVRIQRDRGIYFEGDSADNYYKVLEGTVRLYSILADGRRQIVQFVFPSQFFGLSSEKEYLISAEAVTDVALVRFPRRYVDSLFANERNFAREALDLANDELRAAQKQMILLGRRTAKERLAAFLLDMASSSPDGTNGAFFHLPMTRRDIADFLGLTIETVSRVFGQLKRSRHIELKGSHEVALRRPAELAELVE
jgi:CRP-like cAMP-binding protein